MVSVVIMGLRVIPRYVMGPTSPGEGPRLSVVGLGLMLVVLELLYCSLIIRLDGRWRSPMNWGA